MASVAEITGKSLADIARENGMNYKTLHRRVVVSKGPLEKALSVPVRNTLPGTKEITVQFVTGSVEPGTHLYRIWRGMLKRCYLASEISYPNYGGRGIKVCERWWNADLFGEDMGDPPAGMTLERNDSNGDYRPDNCCWATMQEQQRNRSNNSLVTFGDKTQCIAAWAEEMGMTSAALRGRLKKWPLEVAMTKPRRAKNGG
jgi:hypothetical protein